MTPEMNWGNNEIYHVETICLYDVSEDKELKEGFNWRSKQPLLKQDHQQNGTKLIF